MRNLAIIAAAVLLATGCQKEETITGHGQASGPPPTTAPTDSMKRTYHLRDLQTTTLKANGHEIEAWIMDDEDKRREGMMWLVDTDVKDDQGMLFVFPDTDNRSFWMENTILPLDLIYISPEKKVLNVLQGKPFDKSPLPSAGPAQYVLEMKQGSAARLGIKAGTEITIPATLVGK